MSMFSTDFNTFFFTSSSSSVDLFLLIKVSTVQFHGVPVCGSRHGTCGQTDKWADGRTDMTKAGGTVRQYGSAFRKTTDQDWDSQIKCNCAVVLSCKYSYDR